MSVQDKWKDTSKLFLHYLNDVGTGTEEHYTSSGRQLRNCIDLLAFAIERQEDDKRDVFKNKLIDFGRIWPLSAVELFERFQFVDRRDYFDLMLEVLNKVSVTFYVMTDQPDNALESVPIFLACMGAQIEQNSPEKYNDYLDTGRAS